MSVTGASSPLASSFSLSTSASTDLGSEGSGSAHSTGAGGSSLSGLISIGGTISSGGEGGGGDGEGKSKGSCFTDGRVTAYNSEMGVFSYFSSLRLSITFSRVGNESLSSYRGEKKEFP